MSLIQDAKILAEQAKKYHEHLSHNHVLFEVYEGDLLKYVKQDVEKQITGQSAELAVMRISPINILKMVIDKLSRIYNDKTQREFMGTDLDKEILSYYDQCMRTQVVMQLANEYFNLFKNASVEPFLDDETLKPKLRVMPSDRYFTYSNNIKDPAKVTHFVKIIGKRTLANGRESLIMFAYTKDEFLIFDDKGNPVPELMQQVETGMINTYGVIPMAYTVRTNDGVMPKPDTDTLTMTRLIPVIITDINFAVMFQSFSIFYGIDVDEENLKMNPNAFWRLKSDPNGGGKPSVGIIKPEVDSDKVMNLIQSQMAMWLQSRNIRPGATGQLTAENFASGISKMVDEMDTSAERTKQVPFFEKLENDLWALVINNHNRVWSKQRGFEYPQELSSEAAVKVTFSEQKPEVSYTQILDDVIKELKAGLTSRKKALARLNPDLDDEELDEYIKEIDEERTTEIEMDGEDDSSNEAGSEDESAGAI